MRRIFFIISIVFMAVSCFSDGPSYESAYDLDADFEYTFNYSTTFNSDSLWFDKETGAGIGYGDLAFFHKLNADKSAVVGGFIASYQEMPKSSSDSSEDSESETEDTDTPTDPVALEEVVNTYRAYVKNPSTLRNTYLVFRDSDDMPDHDIFFLVKEYGTCVMDKCYVTNTLEVAEAVAANFEKGDKLVLKATGFLDGQKTGTSAEFTLAEFSSHKDSIVSKWTPFDLSALGSVEYVDFEMQILSDKEDIDIPKYFCIDNVMADVSISY